MAVNTDGENQISHAQAEYGDFHPKLFNAFRRNQLQENKKHGIGIVAFGIKLRALGKNQNKGNA